MPEKIPATIVTGFLGAGKTTLIQNLLRNAKGKRLAILINEFGDIGMDGEIVKGCGIEGCEDEDIIELANGCICCTVADDFLPAMQKLLNRSIPPDHIVIETSGLALPKPLLKAFNWPEVKTKITVDGVVAVVDGKATASGLFASIVQEKGAVLPQDHDEPLAELFKDQIDCADLVVLNKIDEMSDVERRLAESFIVNESARKPKILATSRGLLPIEVLLGLQAEAEDDLEARPSHHELEGEDHDHDDFSSFHLVLPPLSDPKSLIALLSQTIDRHDVLRVKGFLDIAGKEMRLVVQAAGNRLQYYYDRPWEKGERGQGRLVFIGMKDMPRNAIERDMMALEAREA